ncbi:histidine kinase [Sulfurimonas hongkongensis]|uniref:histidine kinase n=1 Tax=Sulfurimonas hongkongensis TaxID=1172190 RepID=T0KQ36_9BACT|nr:HAMP domain-containing sensor histidine kinase [Sulfurimonas hongkongensis]EQB35393.1 histidine kinase [Sulfurimonas hongkongensis]
MTILHKKFIKSLSAISLQRKLFMFIVFALSLIIVTGGIFIYKLVNDTFMQSEKTHIEIIAESLSPRVSVWYFINSHADRSEMDEFLKQMLIVYKLEYIAFKDKNGRLVSESKTSKYIAEDSYNIEYKKEIYTPEDDSSKNFMGTLEIVNSNYMLKELSNKYTIAGVLFAIILTLYFYLEMRLLKGLLMPLSRIATEIKDYMPGDNLVFKQFTLNKDDVIFEIVNGFKQMQQNIDDAMREKAIEEENNKAKDAFLLKQSRFIEMGTMISNIAHQWKQPLNVVQLCISDLTIKSMLGEVDFKYQKKIFEEIDNQVAFMSKTIDVFRNFLNEDYDKKNMKKFYIKKAVEESLQLLDSMFDNKKISIEVNLDKESVAYGSISEIEQAILVILHNAVDAIVGSGKKNGKITIECMIEDKNNIIKIQDNGGGFDDGIVDKIFDAYFTTKHPSQGTGLGLFITKTIVEIRFNGTIEVYNSKEGALFVIKIPLAKEEEKNI